LPIPDLYSTHGTSVTNGDEASGHDDDAGTVPIVLGSNYGMYGRKKWYFSGTLH